MVEYIKVNNIVAAIIIRSEYQFNGINFFTPGEFSQQLGYMNRPKGYEIQPHFHNLKERNVLFTQEVLFIKSGLLKVNFYNPELVLVKNCLLKKGDVILLAFGGHGFEFLEQSEVIEVKQGPYIGDLDKTRF
jgi:hypothetical protein